MTWNFSLFRNMVVVIIATFPNVMETHAEENLGIHILYIDRIQDVCYVA